MKVNRRSLTEQIVAAIRQRIISGDLPEGVPLRQERLAAELGVSRIPLREAIKQLESEGLVTSELHKGAVVSSLSLNEIEELFEIRVQIETWLFGLAIPLLTEADFALAEEVTLEASRSTDVGAWSELNWRFHATLYRPSGRDMALRLLKTIHDNAHRYINLQIAVARDVDRELADHRQLMAFARLRDTEGGMAQLRTHIERVAHNLVASFNAGRLSSRPKHVA